MGPSYILYIWHTTICHDVASPDVNLTLDTAPVTRESSLSSRITCMRLCDVFCYGLTVYVFKGNKPNGTCVIGNVLFIHTQCHAPCWVID